MSFQGHQATYRRLYQESALWKLLRATNAPIILAFLADVFFEESEVSFDHARVALDVELRRCRELGLLEGETSAGTYLNQWIQSGWLREMDNKLTKTDASETALRFCQNLDQRTSGTTASHLRIVQEAVRDFALAVNANLEERLKILEKKKTEIQTEIDELSTGVISELSDVEKRERIREIYQLASVLTGDFRRVEDEIRELDQDIRIQIIEGDSKRGEVLESVMKKEELLSTTDSGSAFESFFQLLCDQNRSTEFRTQLKSILEQPIAEHLPLQQRQFLTHLMRELSRESDRVFAVRRRTEESLRAYLESGKALENRAVDQLLGRLEKLALELREGDVPPNKLTALSLPVGAIKIKSPQSMRLKTPDEQIDTTNVQENTNSRSPSIHILELLDTVRVHEVAKQIHQVLVKYGSMTVSDIVERRPLEFGLEELVAHVRIAKAVGAVVLQGKESVDFFDKKGEHLRASIPKFLLSADLFPNNIEELTI